MLHRSLLHWVEQVKDYDCAVSLLTVSKSEFPDVRHFSGLFEPDQACDASIDFLATSFGNLPDSLLLGSLEKVRSGDHSHSHRKLSSLRESSAHEWPFAEKGLHMNPP